MLPLRKYKVCKTFCDTKEEEIRFFEGDWTTVKDTHEENLERLQNQFDLIRMELLEVFKDIQSAQFQMKLYEDEKPKDDDEGYIENNTNLFNLNAMYSAVEKAGKSLSFCKSSFECNCKK